MSCSLAAAELPGTGKCAQSEYQAKAARSASQEGENQPRRNFASSCAERKLIIRSASIITSLGEPLPGSAVGACGPSGAGPASSMRSRSCKGRVRPAAAVAREPRRARGKEDIPACARTEGASMAFSTARVTLPSTTHRPREKRWTNTVAVAVRTSHHTPAGRHKKRWAGENRCKSRTKICPTSTISPDPRTVRTVRKRSTSPSCWMVSLPTVRCNLIPVLPMIESVRGPKSTQNWSARAHLSNSGAVVSGLPEFTSECDKKYGVSVQRSTCGPLLRSLSVNPHLLFCRCQWQC